MKSEKVYLAGKISGDPNYKQKFADAERQYCELIGKQIISVEPKVFFTQKKE